MDFYISMCCDAKPEVQADKRNRIFEVSPVVEEIGRSRLWGFCSDCKRSCEFKEK